MLINNLVESFLVVLSESNNIDLDKAKKLEDAALKANQGLAPTVDANGRLHAPCNGYWWGEDVYPAGAYLSNEYDCKHAQNEKTKFKTTPTIVELLKGAIKGLSFSSGKNWNDSGVDVCYCYVSGLTATQYKRINEVICKLEDELTSSVVNNRGKLEDGKQDLIVKVVSSFSKFNYYSKKHDLKLNLLTKNNAPIVVNVTDKIWDLVSEKIDELFDKRLSLSGTIKDTGGNTYQLNRPSKIKLL